MSDTIADQNIAGAPPPPGSKRERIAIVFADIVGYSRLMALDEARTYAAWTELLSRLLRPMAERVGGRIIQVMGDGVLAEFPGAEDAVAWAKGVQRGARERPALAADETPIILRIAVHLGEIMRSGDTVFGEDVNIAARLQDHAEPGGVLVSAAARAHLVNAAGEAFRDLGHLALKNIDRPIRAFALGEAQAVAATAPRAAEATLPSIAVLPFGGADGESDEAYFADGVVEDVIHSLAGLRELVVIARASTVAARAASRDVREIGEVLGVRYVLTGSVSRRGGQVRVVAELVETHGGGTLWVERITAPTEALFDVQDRLVERIVAGLAPQVRQAELQRALRKRPGNITAYDYWLRAIDLMGSLDRERFLGARTMLDRALDGDPHFGMAAAWLAQWHLLLAGQGWSEDRAAEARHAIPMARLALSLDPRNAMAFTALGHAVSFLLRDPATGRTQLEEAIGLCPNLARAWMYSSAAHSYLGEGAEAIRRAEQAMRLSPMDQWAFQFSVFRGIGHYVSGEAEEAVRWGAIARVQNPNYASTPKLLIAAYAAAGRLDEAREAARELMALEPGFRLGPYLRDRQPFRDAVTAERYATHLKQSGLPN